MLSQRNKITFEQLSNIKIFLSLLQNSSFEKQANLPVFQPMFNFDLNQQEGKSNNLHTLIKLINYIVEELENFIQTEHEVKQQKVDLQKCIQMMERNIQQLKEENAVLSQQVADGNKEINKLNEKYEQLQQINRKLVQNYTACSEAYQIQESENIKLKMEISFFLNKREQIHSSQQQIKEEKDSKFVQENAYLQEMNAKVKEENVFLKKQLQLMEYSLEQIKMKKNHVFESIEKEFDAQLQENEEQQKRSSLKMDLSSAELIFQEEQDIKVGSFSYQEILSQSITQDEENQRKIRKKQSLNSNITLSSENRKNEKKEKFIVSAKSRSERTKPFVNVILERKGNLKVNQKNSSKFYKK